jgi:Tfp pilus assembly protein PilV
MTAKSKHFWRNRSSKRGYTAAEVIVAISLFTIGGSGVIAMENAAVRGNAGARRLDQATIVGNAFVDRMHKTASIWQFGMAPPPLFGTVDGNTWNPAPSGVNGFDLNGYETNTNIIFCVQHKSTALLTDPVSTQPTAISSDVVVYWNQDLTAMGNCGAAPGSLITGMTATYHYVFLTSVSRTNL